MAVLNLSRHGTCRGVTPITVAQESVIRPYDHVAVRDDFQRIRILLAASFTHQQIVEIIRDGALAEQAALAPGAAI